MPPRRSLDAGLRDVPLLADDPWLRGIWRVHGRETTTGHLRVPLPDARARQLHRRSATAGRRYDSGAG